MQNGYEFNSLEFITAGGAVSIMVAAILLAMSVASWYLIVEKSINIWQTRKAFNDYAKRFWNAPDLGSAIKIDSKAELANLAKQGIAAAEHHRLHAAQNAEKVALDEFVARAMNRCISEENAKLENGLTVLASVGSISPFVGLFGTVWGIYHALASISASGQATLDKVAGPVGEALIMTALGLAVAIPAVLAYNALVRSNRVLSAEIEKFGYQLHILLTTGAVINHKHEGAASTKGHMHIAEVPA